MCGYDRNKFVTLPSGDSPLAKFSEVSLVSLQSFYSHIPFPYSSQSSMGLPNVSHEMNNITLPAPTPVSAHQVS